MKKLFSFIKRIFLKNGSKAPVVLSEEEKRNLLIKKLAEDALNKYSKTFKDLAYYDKHGKFPRLTF